MNMFSISEAASLAVHAAALLAKSNGNGRRSVSEMAGLLGASEHHLAKVMNRLVKAGLVRSARGPRGGFMLARAPESINLAEVFHAVEPAAAHSACLLSEQACRGRSCVLGKLLDRLNSTARQWLETTSLSELVIPFSTNSTADNGKKERTK